MRPSHGLTMRGPGCAKGLTDHCAQAIPKKSDVVGSGEVGEGRGLGGTLVQGSKFNVRLLNLAF